MINNPLSSALFIVNLHLLSILQVYLTYESLSNDQEGKNLSPLIGGLRSPRNFLLDYMHIYD